MLMLRLNFKVYIYGQLHQTKPDAANAISC
nr:MAG TPA: hypothetical protein [Caudoviricetes sp.]